MIQHNCNYYIEQYSIYSIQMRRCLTFCWFLSLKKGICSYMINYSEFIIIYFKIPCTNFPYHTEIGLNITLIQLTMWYTSFAIFIPFRNYWGSNSFICRISLPQSLSFQTFLCHQIFIILKFSFKYFVLCIYSWFFIYIWCISDY